MEKSDGEDIWKVFKLVLCCQIISIFSEKTFYHIFLCVFVKFLVDIVWHKMSI